MRAVLGAVVVLVGTVTATAADKYESKDGRFKIAFPAEPRVTKQDMGGLTMHTITAADGPDKVHMVMYAALPEQVKDVPSRAVLDGAEKGAVTNSGAKLLKSKEIAFGPDKYPARDLLLEKDGNQIRALIVLAGPRVLVVTVGGKGGFATDKAGTAFVDSLEILK